MCNDKRDVNLYTRFQTDLLSDDRALFKTRQTIDKLTTLFTIFNTKLSILSGLSSHVQHLEYCYPMPARKQIDFWLVEIQSKSFEKFSKVIFITNFVRWIYLAQSEDIEDLQSGSISSEHRGHGWHDYQSHHLIHSGSIIYANQSNSWFIFTIGVMLKLKKICIIIHFW